MWRTTWHKHVDRHNRRRAVMHFRMIDIGPPGNRAGSDGDHDLGCWNRFVCFLQREIHVARHRTCDEQPIRVAGRRNELNPEPADVPSHRVEHVGVGFTRVATPGANLAESERPPEKAAQSPVQLHHRRHDGISDNELFPVRRGHAELARECDCPRSTCAFACPAEDAATRVHSKPPAGRRDFNRRCWAHVGAFLAFRCALGTVNLRSSCEPLGQVRRRRVRVSDRTIALLPSCSEHFQHSGRSITNRVRSRTD